ncbi:LOW QUALITY PROTEIN: Protein CBG04988, partial [Caenorhabditis briggsae]
KHKGVCKSPECITLAHQLHNWRDVSVDPCQNFYKAVCGKYNEHSLYNEASLSRNTKIVANVIKEYLHNDFSSSSKSENAIKLFFDKCEATKRMNTLVTLNEKREILKMIKQFGSWRLLSKSWNESEFDSNDMLSQITRFGGTRLGFFNLILTNEILFIHDPSGITQSIEEVEEVRLFNFFFEFGNMQIQVLMDIVKLSGSHPDSKMIQKDIKDLMKLNEEKSVNFQLQKILETTPKRTLANYLIANLIMRMSMGNQILDCGMIVIRNLPLASLRVFTRNHFNKFNLDMASQLVEDIKESLKQTIQESTWLQEETKKSALLKLKHMKKTIGYPKELEVPGALDVFFESVDMSNKDTYFAAILEINRFQTEQTFNNLASLLPMVPDVKLLDSNAFYHMDENHLKLNVAILDDPFFHTYPTYAKIASIGEVIGHEIGHGFDTDGRKRDEKGKKRDWWTPEDSKEYDRRAQCLIDQYNNYDDPDYVTFLFQLNGSMTIDEMAADQIGVELSWKTYNRVDFSLEPSIFGFEDEKPDKLFFHLTALVVRKNGINASIFLKNWCGPRPKTILSTRTSTKAFAKAFNCPVGSPMNPENKCELF